MVQLPIVVIFITIMQNLVLPLCLPNLWPKLDPFTGESSDSLVDVSTNQILYGTATVFQNCPLGYHLLINRKKLTGLLLATADFTWKFQNQL